MDRVAIFVDAGYLFAQGSAAIAGTKQPRTLLTIDPIALIGKLVDVADQKTDRLPLLRTYWYDGALGNRGLTSEQTRLAQLDNVKIRLGFVNNAGEQKGVDSLIVTDMIELARHKAISDAVLLTGDEDVRVGVQIVQTFGVRVHLIGITPSRGSQSAQLLQEVDTTSEWDVPTISTFMTVRQLPTAGVAAAAPVVAVPSPSATNPTPALEVVVDGLVDSLDTDDIADILSYWTTQNGVPPEFDGKLLARARDALGRDLDTQEKREIRSLFTAKIRAKCP